MTATSRMTAAVTALVMVLGLGLFGQMGWLAALVLALIGGGLLGLVVHWLVDQGPRPMQGSDWAPGPATVPAPAPLTAAVTTPMPAPMGEAARDIRASADPLVDLKGIGPKIEQALHDAGVTRFDQIAAWDDAAIQQISGQVGRSAARIRSEDWVGQARARVAGS